MWHILQNGHIPNGDLQKANGSLRNVCKDAENRQTEATDHWFAPKSTNQVWKEANTTPDTMSLVELFTVWCCGSYV